MTRKRPTFHQKLAEFYDAGGVEVYFKEKYVGSGERINRKKLFDIIVSAS